MNPFPIAQSLCPDTRDAIGETFARAGVEDAALVMFFCSVRHDTDLLAEVAQHCCPDVPLIGCTAAGGLGPECYAAPVLTVVSLPRAHCVVACAGWDDLARFDEASARTLVAQLRRDLAAQVGEVPPGRCFALQLIDSLSACEEGVTRHLQAALGATQLVGGSAGDDLLFQQSRVFRDGAFRSGVVVALVYTELPFQTFMTQHFEATDARLVVTEADEAHRVVREINGYPAAEEYALSIGVPVRALQPRLFGEYPVVVTIGGNHYVRSIQRMLPDGALSFYCAIEEGVVLRVAHSADLLANLATLFAQLQARVGTPALIFGCDCALRMLEAERTGVAAQVRAQLAAHHVAGFCSFGEQYRGVHINQTFTGVAIGLGGEISDV